MTTSAPIMNLVPTGLPSALPTPQPAPMAMPALVAVLIHGANGDASTCAGQGTNPTRTSVASAPAAPIPMGAISRIRAEDGLRLIWTACDRCDFFLRCFL